MQDDNNQYTSAPARSTTGGEAYESDLSKQTAISHTEKAGARPARSRKWIIVTVFMVVALGMALFLGLKLLDDCKDDLCGNSGVSNTKLPKVSGDSISLDSLGTTYASVYTAGVSEFSEDKESATIKAYDELTRGFKLNNKYKEDKALAIVSLAIARGYLDNQDKYLGYRSAMYSAFGEYLNELPEQVDDEYFVPSDKDHQIARTLLANTDKELSNKFINAIESSGVKNEAEKALRSADLDPFEVLVMNFDQGSSQQEKFSEQNYMFGAMPTMWVQSVDDTVYLVATKDYAQDFISQPFGDVRYSVIHELVHTQKPFIVGDLGRNIEERRAELLSGDKSAYYDAKQLFIYLRVFSGGDFLSLLNDNPTDNASFILNTYRVLGVDGGNALITSAPGAFLIKPSGAVIETQKVFGGADGAIQAAISIGDKDGQNMSERMDERYGKLISVFKSKTEVLEDLDDNLGGAYKMPSAASQMKSYISKNK